MSRSSLFRVQQAQRRRRRAAMHQISLHEQRMSLAIIVGPSLIMLGAAFIGWLMGGPHAH